MSARRVFESLCMDPGCGGFSYDTELLVDVDRALDFDEAVIRLTTKCNSIVMQLRTLGHPVTEFSIASTKVGAATRTSRSKHARSISEDSRHNTPEGRSLKAMEELWGGLKRKNYSGMVAVARLTRSSIPKNGCGTRYSVHALKEALLSHIQAYFMFQAYNPKFQPWSNSTRDEDDDPQNEYLVFLVYRIQPISTHAPVGKRSIGLSEMERLDASWHFDLDPNKPKRKRQLSTGSSVSSSSSISSSISTPTCGMPGAPASYPNIQPAITPPPPLYSSTISTETVGYNLDWREWSAPEEELSRSRVKKPVQLSESQMVLRHKKDSANSQQLRSGRCMTRASSKLSP